MGDRTVSNIVNQVATAVWTNMQPLYLPEPTLETWMKVACDFETKWQFPHCVGAIDGKHICIQKPSNSGSSFFNYKHSCSIVLMATVDSESKFTTIDVGSMGRFSDGHVFSNSPLGKKIESNSVNIPKPEPIEGVDGEVPYIFVGDAAFALLENLLRPYPKSKTKGNFENKVFNYRLSLARQRVECAFGILASRFRVFMRPFTTKVDTVDKVVKAACVLHNYLGTHMTTDTLDELEAQPENHLVALNANASRGPASAFQVREQFKLYFNSERGSVSWQRESVLRGKY